MGGLAYEHAVDEMIFVHVVHGIADVHLFHHPSGRKKQVGDENIEVLVLVGTVALPLERRVEYEVHLTVLVVLVIGIEERHDGIDGVVLHVERLQYIELAVNAHLADHEPVNVRVRIEGYHQWGIRVTVSIQQATVLQASHHLQCQLRRVGSRVPVDALAHGAIESIPGYADVLAHDRGGKRQCRQVALHAPNEVLTQYGQVKQRGIAAVQQAVLAEDE